MQENFDNKGVVDVLNRILEAELAGVVRYTHYSFMVYGYNRIPIVAWLREQAAESIGHAQQAGEMITLLGEHPSLSIGKLLETQRHDVGDILREALDNERVGLALYQKLLDLVAGRDIMLEEYARRLITEESMHLAEVDKMLRRPGEVETFATSSRDPRREKASP
jgi:bacterioferritin